jgi:hypothetical protein
MSYSASTIAVDYVNEKGEWQYSSSRAHTERTQLSAAYLLSDQVQFGLLVPVVKRSVDTLTTTALGDLTTSFTYEVLPQLNYNPYQPQIWTSLSWTLPTGKSKFDSEEGGLDSTGNGLQGLGWNTLATLALSDFDFFSQLEVHHYFTHSFIQSDILFEVHPEWGGSLSLGVGYNLGNLRIGSSLLWSYEDPMKLRLELNSEGLLERSTTTTLSLSYLWSDEWSSSLSYSDQTWFGSPLNTSLAQTVALQVQKRWLR